MNKRKPIDYTSMYKTLDTLMQTELPEVALYFEIGPDRLRPPGEGGGSYGR